MNTRVKIGSYYRVFDLSRVRRSEDLNVGDRVLLKHTYTKELCEGRVIGIVRGCVTIEIVSKRGEPDYKMIESKSLYRSVYKIN